MERLLKNSAANQSETNPHENKCALCLSDAKIPPAAARGPKIKRKPRTRMACGGSLWRKRWDSNPRAREGYLISSFIAVCYLHGFSCQFQPALYARKPA